MSNHTTTRTTTDASSRTASLWALRLAAAGAALFIATSDASAADRHHDRVVPVNPAEIAMLRALLGVPAPVAVASDVETATEAEGHSEDARGSEGDEPVLDAGLSLSDGQARAGDAAGNEICQDLTVRNVGPIARGTFGDEWASSAPEGRRL